MEAAVTKAREEPLPPHHVAIIMDGNGRWARARGLPVQRGARAAKLERFAPGILLAIDGYLDLIEPHLDDILERLDDIEPLLPVVLDNLEVVVSLWALASRLAP